MTGRTRPELGRAGVLVLLALVLAGCGETGFTEGYLEATARRTRHQVTNEVRLRARQFAPTVMRVDLTDASARERKLLEALLRAAGLADEIFWRQTGPMAIPYRAQVRASYPRDHIVREFYTLQMGPYDRLDADRPYMDVPPKPPGAGFYPSDLTAEKFRSWLEDRPGDREAFRDPYTVIRRRGDSLVAVPYHREYRDLVEPMAAALRDAASHADDPRLERVLELRARAVLTGRHFAADTAWVGLDDARIQVVIGPYETREDRLLGLKRAYGASVGLVDSAASAETDRYRRQLADLGATSAEWADREPDVTVVRDIYRGGLLGTGRQRAAASLSGDPRVRSAAGTKRILWKNVLDARFDSIVAPVGRGALAEEQRDAPTGDIYYRLMIFREMARPTDPGPGATGQEGLSSGRTPNHPPAWVEEAGAGAAGIAAMERLSREGALDPKRREARLTTYLADLLRRARFGTERADERAALVSLNWHLRRGGVSYDSASARYRVETDAMGRSVRSLADELLTVQSTGDRARAEGLWEEYGSPPSSLEAVRGRLGDLPLDVVPRYRIRW